ncbi:MAG: 1-acyl-sn-glycerol-3-phosphate acyltransferase [Clostridia bacterium]|nr:1-acyl-sn-glycerol-3-phosphate acyltransferase [Clostridia bacterium]
MKKKKWIKFRHKFTRKVIYPLVWLYVKAKSGAKVKKFNRKGKGPYVILFNHQTGYDQFIIAMSFKFPIYLLASDDVLSNGFYSRVLEYFGSPIPIKKNVTDMNAVKTCIKAVKEGATIAISPEGNRTYSGETCYFNPSIVPLVKKLGVPLIMYRIEGGYGALPRWADKGRKGNLVGYVKRVVEPEEIEKLSKEELHELIKSELYLNEFDLVGKYTGKSKAEYLERVAYYCPKCELTEFASNGDVIKCKKCGLEVEYLDDKSLSSLDKEFPYKNYLEWYKAQCGFINKLDLVERKDELFYQDQAKLYKVIPRKRKHLLEKQTKVSLYGGKIVISKKDEQKEILFKDAQGISVLGRNKLNVYYQDEVYQLKGDKRFNAVKYLNFYHRYNNQLKGDNNEFLGL